MRKGPGIFIFTFSLIALIGVHSTLSASGVFAAAQATTAPSIFIQNPRGGQALQGIEIIEGKIRGEGFTSGKISFSYPAEEDKTWFYIADIKPGTEESSQTSYKVEWDTTQITDGNYNIRVVAEYKGKATIFELIPNLRIRNHSPVETSTPAPVDSQVEVEVPLMPTRGSVSQNTPTPLPGNPAVLDSIDLYQALIFSGILVTSLFLIGGIYVRIRNRFR